jgi:hypothetical protein
MRERSAPRRARRRRFARALVSTDSYGSILVLLLITYVASATATQQWQRSIIVVLQVFTVSLALRVAGARRVVLTIAAIALAYAVVVAVVALFSDESDLTTGLLFIASAVLYLLAPLSIRSTVLQRRSIRKRCWERRRLSVRRHVHARVSGTAVRHPFFQGGVDATVPRVVLQLPTSRRRVTEPQPAAGSRWTAAVGEMLSVSSSHRRRE